MGGFLWKEKGVTLFEESVDVKDDAKNAAIYQKSNDLQFNMILRIISNNLISYYILFSLK